VENWGPGWEHDRVSQFPVPLPVSSTSTVPVSTRRSGQDRTEIVEGQGTWMARTGWAFVGGGRGVGVWWRRGDPSHSGETDFSQEPRGSRSRETAEQSRQGRAASNAAKRTSTIISPSENCVKGSATPPDCPPSTHHGKFSFSSTYKYTDSRGLKPHTSHLTPHASHFPTNSPLPPANSRRAQGSGWHTVQDTAADPPCNFLPARHSVLDLF
jgi:hypothetical protein